MMTDDNAVVLYERDGRIAHITLNRPEKLNAINETMPQELRTAVQRANQDEAVHVIVLSGAGRAFCSGYDLEIFAEPAPGSQEMPRWVLSRRCGRGMGNWVIE